VSHTVRTESADGPDPLSRGLTRSLNPPRRALVEASAGGCPRRINRQEVALVREEWRIVDRWWTEEPIQRRYFDCVLESGQAVIVFHDAVHGGWFTQRA
jgi:hypothetical protein